MHVDLNCFFARCEVIRNPKLAHKPLAIGAIGRRGVISTCTYEARKLGIHSGMPTFEALEIYPSLILLPGDYKYYSLMSREFFAYAHAYTAKVEEASIDECYMDITDLVKNKDVNLFLKEFQKGLLKKCGLECSIGVGPTRFLAKMGSDYKKPLGITIIRKKDIKNIIYPLPIEDYYGIGRKTAPKLKSLGINTIGDLANLINNDQNKFTNFFGSYLDEIKKNLNGTSDNHVYLETSDPKSIGNSMTLMMDTNDEEEIDKAILMLCNEVSERTKREKKKGRTLQLVIRDTNFITHQKSITLDKAIYETNDLHKIALSLYKKYFVGVEVRLVGVTLSHLIPFHDTNVQLSFFDEVPVDKVNDVINNINRKFKRKVVDKASLMLKDKHHGY